ncbi:MAG: metallophosphoesterase [Flavobacteriaceae bacterium]|nr:metallophosphoesterase [Flavobacteriaceae bacterium]
MDDYTILSEDQSQFDDINKKFEEALADGAHRAETKNEANEFWAYMQECERYVLNGSLQTGTFHHDMENALVLYHLNNLIDQGHLTQLLRTHFDLPAAQVRSEMIPEEWNYAGWVVGDGTIYAASRYCQLDYRWTLVMVFYYYYKLRPEKKHPFVPAAMKVLNDPVLEKARIAIIGDWGTGIWKDGKKQKCPAELVIQGVLDLDPDYIIHLGDVYYAGTPKEERKHLLDLLPSKYKNKVYTMNSNHEMYDGANGLLGTTLQNTLFEQQGGSSYFSLEIGDWVLVGLDSAYYDDSYLYMSGSLCNEEGGQQQLDYLTKAGQGDKKVMLMTHHNGILVDKDGPATNTTLWSQVQKALDGGLPDVWYWGHVHNAIIYRDDLSLYKNSKTGTALTSIMRCCGHASIPFGNGDYLKHASAGSNPDVLFYATTPMPDPTDEVQKLRVINGFAMIEINGSDFSETFYEVSNENPKPKQVWPAS